jgi:hypothetical protein
VGEGEGSAAGKVTAGRPLASSMVEAMAAVMSGRRRMAVIVARLAGEFWPPLREALERAES